MPKTFGALCDEFNATAKAYLRADVSMDLLATKYSVLMNHKAENADERRAFVESFYACGLDALKACARTGGKQVDHQATIDMVQLYTRLTEEDGILLIPAAAPAELSEASLDLLRRAEDPEGGSHATRNYLVKLAGEMLAAADKIRAAHEKARVDVSTSQDITPSRKIELKKDGLSL